MCALESELSSPAAVAAVDASSMRDAVREAHQLLMAAHPELACVAEAELWIERAVAVLAANIASGRFASACRHEQDCLAFAVPLCATGVGPSHGRVGAGRGAAGGR